jgi:5-formyltetrahydrofolate cyclo-ligase
MTKTELRQMMIAKRTVMKTHDVKLRSQALVEKLMRDYRFIVADIVAIYEPINNEVDLRGLYQTSKRFALPKVVGTDMHFIEITTETELVRSSFGILEPRDGRIVDDNIDLLLVPTLALDRNYYRIGFGKGYYDRFLAAHKPKMTLGVVYDFQLIDGFDHHKFDIPLDGALIA